MQRRRRFKHTASLKERLLAFAEETRAKAQALPSGPERDQLMKKAAQAETASEQEGWAGPEAGAGQLADALRPGRHA